MFDKNEQEISQIIAEGLEAVLSGKATLEEVIAAHPEQEALLRPELEGARWLISQQEQVRTRPGFVTASRKRVVERIQQEASNHNAKHSFFGMIWPQRVAYRWVAALSLFFILLSGMGGVVTYSQNSLPGDDLYQVKRAYEQVAITVAPNEVQRASLAAQFSRRRLDEAQQLITKGDYAAAESSLAEFEQGVHQAVSLLQQVSDKQLNAKHDAAVSLQQNLSNNAEQLTQMAPDVPTQMLGDVIHARDTSVNGVIAVSKVIDEVKDKKSAGATSTPVPPQPTNPINIAPPILVPPTLMATNTTQPQPTAVFIPVKTATSIPPAPATSVPPPSYTPEVTLAPTAAISTLVPTSTVAPSETPTDIPTATITPIPVEPTGTPSDTPLPQDTPTNTVMPTATPTSLPGSPTPISGASSVSQTPTLQLSLSNQTPTAGGTSVTDPSWGTPSPTVSP